MDTKRAFVNLSSPGVIWIIFSCHCGSKRQQRNVNIFLGLCLSLSFSLLGLSEHRCENTDIKNRVCIAYATTDVLWFMLFFDRTKQEPEEAIRATHQVLLPGRGGKWSPLPSVSCRHGQHQRAMVGTSRPSQNRPTGRLAAGVFLCLSNPGVSGRLPSLSFSWIKTVEKHCHRHISMKTNIHLKKP